MYETRSTIAVQNLSVKPRIGATVAIIGAGTMGAGMALDKTLKELLVLTGNAFGFIGNCICNAYRKQCRTSDDVVHGHHERGDTSCSCGRYDYCGCGAIALGHPMGASGARLATTAVNRLFATGDRFALCIGVGQDVAMILERV